MVVFLLSVIAIGVLLMSEGGRGLLSIAGSILIVAGIIVVIGIALYFVYYLFDSGILETIIEELLPLFGVALLFYLCYIDFLFIEDVRKGGVYSFKKLNHYMLSNKEGSARFAVFLISAVLLIFLLAAIRNSFA